MSSDRPDLDALIAERDRLRAALGFDQPWPLRDVVARLVEAAEHLHSDHQCDAHGYEEVMEAVSVARRYLSILGALALLTPKPEEGA